MTIQSKIESRCTRCHATIAVGTRVDWTRGVGIRHLTQAECNAALAAQPPAPAPVKVTGTHAPIADFINAAKARGLKFPKARFLAPDGQTEMRLSIAGGQSKAPGAVNVVLHPDHNQPTVWLGRIERDGTVAGRLADASNLLLGMAMPHVLGELARIAADPADAARRYGALMGRCSFCNARLTDEGSVEVGYGPVCAQKWGLPHTPKGTLALEHGIEV